MDVGGGEEGGYGVGGLTLTVGPEAAMMDMKRASCGVGLVAGS